MKTINKLFIGIVMFIITLTTSFRPAMAQRGAMREDARAIIHHTRLVIEEAQKIVAQGKVFTGDLSRAISHQHEAISLYGQGNMAGAINHSLCARQFAFDAVRANKGEIRAEWQFDEKEQNYAKASPPREQLEREVNDAHVDADLKDERVAATRYIDLDLAEIAPPPQPAPIIAPQPDIREDAQYIIHRTRLVIEEGQRIVAQGKIYTGDLVRAIANQHQAMNLYNRGIYAGAINHSLLGRQFAFDAIRANKAEIRAEWQLDEKEQNYARKSPPKEQLEKEVHDANVDADLKDDRATTTTYTDLDVVYERHRVPTPATPPVSQVVEAPQPDLRADAFGIIHRTRIVIEEGQRIVVQGKVYTGDLAMSISHQHLAVRLFNGGQFARSINQAIRARQLAFAAIRANKAEIRDEWQLDDREKNYVKSAPADADLDKEVHDGNVDAGLKDEIASTTTYIDLDVDGPRGRRH